MPTWSPTHAVFALYLSATRPDPVLDRLLRHWLVAGLLAVILFPALRGSSAWLGWWPMWLVAMPAVAWWALHRFRLPQGLRTAGSASRRRGRRQARRRIVAGAASRRPASPPDHALVG
ncbi:hypothetical protein MNQ95_05120 [Pseudoxanthomonas daejeonensis]|uniref:hypothetical protein n=1 Tax=Pseudoxanthomonas daejeonensis TaxID=266062 RepID=UPI001F543090|nr:hypothetical protein [Pseudoxanthomonas daejeonensis]UNK58477.1 hypothetical protein MNQ95_05120 [Pseudoxanthomonas daejeonensis]